jgi:hypothetical protein
VIGLSLDLVVFHCNCPPKSVLLSFVLLNCTLTPVTVGMAEVDTGLLFIAVFNIVLFKQNTFRWTVAMENN